MKKAALIIMNVIILGFIAFFAVTDKGNITGYAVMGNQSFVASYMAYMNLTDTETKEITAVSFKNSNVYFMKQPIPDFSMENMRMVDNFNVDSNGTYCGKGTFKEVQYYYDSNKNGFHDAEEQYVFIGTTDEKGCVAVELPEEGYIATLGI